MVIFFKFRTILVLKAEAVKQRCYVKKVFLKISQNSQAHTCEFCESFKNIFFLWNTSGAASVKALPST